MVTVPLAILLLALARTSAARACFTVLAVTLAVGVPWIVAPLLAGAAWLCWPQPGGRVRDKVGTITVAALVASLLLGAAAGAAAWFPVQRQISESPIIFDIVSPTVPELIIAVPLLALANALGEEVIWRGALLSEMTSARPVYIYAAQAASFGLAHWYGIPNGWLGLLLTGAFSVLCTFAHRRWGLTSAVAAHLAADVVIFTACLPHVLFIGWGTG